MMMDPGQRDTLLTIERRTAGPGLRDKPTWAAIGKAWAEVQDVLPSRGEREAGGMTTLTRPARVRMDYRTDITADDRFVAGSRIMQIISGPAKVDSLDAVEFMVAEYLPGAG